MSMPISGETSLYKIVTSLRSLWQLTQGLPALVTALQGDVTAVEGDVTTLQGQVAALQATRPAFSVHKNGTNQTGVLSGTDTQVTFSTEAYDRGGHFASNVWTPPAGLVLIRAQIFATGTLVVQNARISITKNGATTRYKSAFGHAAAANAGLDIAMADVANGTDAYGVAINVATSAGNVTVDGTAENTWFTGEWLQA